MKNPGLNARDYAQEFYPAIVYAIKLLLDEKERREGLCKSERKSSKKNYTKKEIKKITTAQIDEIVRIAFNVSKEAITAIRMCYCKKGLGDTEKKKPFTNQFYPRLFVKHCKKEIDYDVSQEDLEFILLLLDYARPISAFYIEDKGMIHYKETKEAGNEWLDTLYAICNLWPNVSYWNIILKYIRNLKTETYEIIYLIATLPTLYEHRVAALKQRINKMQTSLSVHELEVREEKYSYIKNFEKDLKKLYEKKMSKHNGLYDLNSARKDILDGSDDKTRKDEIDGFMNLSISDLYFAYCNREFMAQIAYYPIRPRDLSFVFSYMTKLDDKTQLEVLRLIEKEDKIHPLLVC